jgi:DUF1009 family protein
LQVEVAANPSTYRTVGGGVTDFFFNGAPIGDVVYRTPGVADSILSRGGRVVLFPIRGWADPAAAAEYPHHWIAIGQAGRFTRLMKKEGCRDLVLIGNLIRPALREVRLDFMTLRLLPRIVSAFRGGDDHLLSGVGRLFEDRGNFRLVSAKDIAPEVRVREGVLGRNLPSERDLKDIQHGVAVLQATGPFDIGQAVVVSDKHILALEAAEGTDRMLQRIANLREVGRIKTPRGRGVLVKGPKPGQDQRFDLPTIGPQTIEEVSRAGLAGLAVVAGAALIAEPTRVIQSANAADLFVTGVREMERPS